jgi:predicted HAD superfamily phosphohydrolase YqeG
VRARALRKPNEALLRLALCELGCAAPHEALVVGDQYLTDIAPANLLGVRTVKVTTVERRSFPLVVRALQRAEEMLYQLNRLALRAPRA